MARPYRVEHTEEQRAYLSGVVGESGITHARMLTREHSLLKANHGEAGLDLVVEDGVPVDSRRLYYRKSPTYRIGYFV